MKRGIFVVAAIVSIASSAHAQADDTATALSLFEEGKKLATEGNYAEGCPKLLASYNLVQKVGTLLNLADCYEKQGKTASAWARFTEAATMAERAGQNDRVEFAHKHAAELAPRLSRLTVVVATRPPGLEVKRDGAALDPAVFGAAVPVDPGPHGVEAHAPGKKPWSGSVDVPPNAGVASIEIPALSDVEAPPQPVALPVATPNQMPLPETKNGGTQRTLGIVAGAVGLAAIGGSFLFGAFANAEYDRSNCNGDLCTREGLDHRDSASTLAGIATGLFIGGLVLTAAGVTLYLTAPSSKSAASIGIGRTW